MSDDEENQVIIGGVRGCVLLVDVSPSMWAQGSEDNKPINLALEATLALLRKMIIETPKQLVGVSLYATDKSDGQGIGNVIQLVMLGEPTVEAITKIKNLTYNAEDIINEWGSTDNFNLADALWQGSKMFSGCKKVMNSQSVILLTCLGEPDPNTQRVVLKKTKDLRELNIDIGIVNLSEKTIPPNSFYIEMGKVIMDNPNLEWEPPEPVTSVEDVLPLLWSNHHRASAYACLKFLFSPDVYMSTKLYYLQKKKDKPKKVYLNRETNEAVKSYNVTQAVKDEEDGENSQESHREINVISESPSDTFSNNNLSNITPLSKSDITYTTTFGQRKIHLTNSELFALNKFAGHPCIKLLGFKPDSVLNMPELYLKNSAFIYPNESDIEGSTTLFLALRDSCIAQSRVPICLLIPRWRSHSTPVALIPQKRVMNGGRQIYPDGFHVVYLPYADNLKEVPLTKPLDLTFDHKHCMENIMNKLKINYDENTFENPALQTFYKNLEALALEEDLQEIEDTTRPETEAQDERLGELIDKFQEIFGSMVVPAKRSQNSDKPNKKQAVDSGTDVEWVESILTNDTVNQCKVAELKQILKCDKISNIPALSGLKKDQLVQLVCDNKENILSSIKSAGQ